MTKQQTLSVVKAPTGGPSPELAALSPARQQLAKRIKDRADADAALEEAVKQHQRIEKLVPDKKAMQDRIAELEREQGVAIEQWAVEGESAEPPRLVHAAEIEQLKKKLREAEVIEPSAKAAAARIVEQITDCHTDCRRAIERVQDAVAGVVFEEAKEKIAELDEIEQRAAELHGDLLARSRHLLLEEQLGRSVGALSTTLRQMVPRRLELAPDVVNQKVRSLQDFAERLVTNPHAQLEG